MQSLEQLISQEATKRKDIIAKFKDSLTDCLAMVASFTIMITGFRFIYLVAILSVNGHLTYFNSYLMRVSNSALLIIKLQQAESQVKSLQSNPNKQTRKIYLSLKYCIWLSFIEWLMDILVLPFIVAYVVLIPWRLNSLFKLYVT